MVNFLLGVVAPILTVGQLQPEIMQQKFLYLQELRQNDRDDTSKWSPFLQTYYLLASNGKLYAMGDNSNRQLGDGSTNTSTVWNEVTAVSGSNTLGGNIVWISPNEHSNYANSATINAD
jgi:hypothetical protein